MLQIAHHGAQSDMNIISILKILFYVSIFIWLFPPIRQWKTRFFYFFLILALADPISIFISLFIIKNNYFYFPLISYLQLISIINYKNIPKLKAIVYNLLLVGIIILLFIFNQPKTVVPIIHFIITIIFMKELLVKFVFDRMLNIFYLMLIFYEFTIILKYLNVILGFTDATAFFIITSIFQIAFGLFFSIFREDKTSIALKRG